MAMRIAKRKTPHLPHKPSSPSPSPSPPIIPWISPLQYLPTSTPNSTRTPGPTPKPPKRFLSHSETIRLINRQSDPQKALDIFNSASLHPSFTHTHSTFLALLLNLARHRKFPAILLFLRHVIPLHPTPFHESLLLRLMPFFSRSRLPSLLLLSFHSILPITRRNPSPKALSVALTLLLDSGQAPLARQLLVDARTRYRLRPNACIHNILVKHHCSSNNLPAALDILNRMDRPNVITYSTIMRALSREGRLKDTFLLFEQMIERDRIVPDQITYNVLIDGFCRQGSVGKGREIMNFMRRNGCEPNKFNYSSLMNGFCRAGKVEEARAVLAEMRDAGVGTDAVTYTALVSCLCREGRVDEGFALVREMREEGIDPDVVTYNVVLEGLCKGGRVKEAMALLERLPFEGVKLNVASYRIVMNCLCGGGDMERAVGLLGLMLGRGFVPHFAASNQLLVGLCEVGRIVDATVALCGLMETGFCPEVATWARVVESVCRERKVRKAFELLDNLIVLE